MVYPNPAGDMLKLEIPATIKDVHLTLKIYSSDAKLKVLSNIEPGKGGSVEVNLEGFPSGIYFLQLTNAEREINISRKFMRK